MRIQRISGLIKRRILVNYRVAPEVLARLLPEPLRPKLYEGHGIAGICLIRLEQVRPAGLPAFFGLSSENAAHRIAVEWKDAANVLQEGVFIPRRDTSSLLAHIAGGRVFPGESQRAHFAVTDHGGNLDFTMASMDGQVRVHLRGRESVDLPTNSCFSCLADSSRFFENGSLGYSSTRHPGHFDGLRLKVERWQVRALEIETAQSSFFENVAAFPSGSAVFDHALLMRDIQHEWHTEADLNISSQ